MAAPLVAGTAALLRAHRPALQPRAVAQRIKRNAALLCGSALAQVDAMAALTNTAPAALSCP